MLEAVREMSAWDRRGSLPKGTGKGVAFQFAHAGYVAYVVEVSVDAKKAIKVNRAWCAVDIGRQIVNPSQSENLVHGGLIEGMSHLMSWAITIDKGRVVQRNFHQHQPTRMCMPQPASRSGSFRRTSIRRGSASRPFRRPSGDHQRHLRGDRRSHPVVAVGESRLPLDVVAAGDSAGSVTGSSTPNRSPRSVQGSVQARMPIARSTAIAGVLLAGLMGLHAQSSPQERTLVAHDFSASPTDGSCPETPARRSPVPPSGGHPGGYISHADEAVGRDVVLPGARQRAAALAAAENGTLSYSLKQSADDPGFLDDDVIIVGPAGRLSFRFARRPARAGRLLGEAHGRGRLALELERAASQEQIHRVLANPTSLEIRGEHYTGPDEGALDNVVLRAGG